jgi:hypothetical protein
MFYQAIEITTFAFPVNLVDGSETVIVGVVAYPEPPEVM